MLLFGWIVVLYVMLEALLQCYDHMLLNMEARSILIYTQSQASTVTLHYIYCYDYCYWDSFESHSQK